MTNSSLQRRIVEDYLRTTSGASLAVGEAAFDAGIAGLKRRLGRWLDVSGNDVLDLGCGTGQLCFLVLREGAGSATGVNLSGAELEIARSRSNASFVESDVAEYLEGCPPDSVDRIFALNILEHLEGDVLLRVLSGCHRVLRHGGQLVAMVPNATSPFGGMTRYWDITHRWAFTPSSLAQLSRLVGFGDNIAFRECGPIPHGAVSAIRYVLWQAIRVAIRGYLLVELASTKGGIYTADMLVRFAKHSADERVS